MLPPGERQSGFALRSEMGETMANVIRRRLYKQNPTILLAIGLFVS